MPTKTCARMSVHLDGLRLALDEDRLPEHHPARAVLHFDEVRARLDQEHRRPAIVCAGVSDRVPVDEEPRPARSSFDGQARPAVSCPHGRRRHRASGDRDDRGGEKPLHGAPPREGSATYSVASAPGSTAPEVTSQTEPSLISLSPKTLTTLTIATCRGGSVISKPDCLLLAVPVACRTDRRSPGLRPWRSPPAMKSCVPRTSRMSVRQGRSYSLSTRRSTTSEMAAAMARSFKVASYSARLPKPATSPLSVLASPEPF